MQQASAQTVNGPAVNHVIAFSGERARAHEIGDRRDGARLNERMGNP